MDVEKLLKDQRVVDEIHRHLWIESEKAGYDIGFEAAKNDWLKNFSRVWVEYHMPELLVKERKVESAIRIQQAAAVEHNTDDAASAHSRKRRAKSYI